MMFGSTLTRGLGMIKGFILTLGLGTPITPPGPDTPIYTTRIKIIGTAARRMSIDGTAGTRLNVRGTSGQRIGLEGTSP